MLFARWQHHLRFCSGFPYAPVKAMVTKISKWSRIQDSCRITPQIKSLVVFATPDIPSKFQKDPSITFWVILLTHRETNRQTKSGKKITSLAEVIKILARIIDNTTISRTNSNRHIWETKEHQSCLYTAAQKWAHGGCTTQRKRTTEWGCTKTCRNCCHYKPIFKDSIAKHIKTNKNKTLLRIFYSVICMLPYVFMQVR